MSRRRAEVWEECSEKADEREIGADLENVRDAVLVGEGAEEGGADAAETEGEAEEETGHRAYFAGNEFLRVNQDGGEGGGEDQANDRAQDGAPEEVCVRERESEGRDAENRYPDD